MPTSICQCQCKMCRVPGTMHCHSHPYCGVPALYRGIRPSAPRAVPVGSRPLDERDVAQAMLALKRECGSHSPSVAQIERAVPGLVQVDACFLSNPYATDEVMTRLRAIPAGELERMVAHYPSQAPAIGEILAPHLGVPAECLLLANGACEVIQALLADERGTMLISMPTFSAYYEFARGPVVANHLDQRRGFRVDLDALEEMIVRYAPDTVVIINPNNPDGGLIPHDALVGFLERVHARVNQVIIDESFSHFTTEAVPATVANLVCEMPNLVVVNSLSKSHGIAGLRLGYAVMSAQRAKALRDRSLWNLNAFAEWFCTLLGDPTFQRTYQDARRRYIRDTRALFTELDSLPGAKAFPTAANFALLRLDRPAAEVAAALLARHGIYVRDCADKRGLDHGERFIRIAARTGSENGRIVDGLRAVLSAPLTKPLRPITREPAVSTG